MSNDTNNPVVRGVGYASDLVRYDANGHAVPVADTPTHEARIVAAARALNKCHAEMCNVNEADSWATYGGQFRDDARAALAAADAADAALSVPATVEKLFTHQLLNHEGRPNGVYLGTTDRRVTEQSHVEGETDAEILEWVRAPQPTPAALSVPSAVGNDRVSIASAIRAAWFEREASHGNRAGEYHGGYMAGLDAAVAIALATPQPPAPVPAVPPGWAFYTADFSMKAHETAPVGHATLMRTGDDFRAWFALSDEDRDRIPLYITKSGPTIQEAIAAACEAALSAHNITGAPDHG